MAWPSLKFLRRAIAPRDWIATAQKRLATTGRGFRHPLNVIAGEATQSRSHESRSMLPVLHVVFSESGAASLREAIEARGRDEPVISHPDDLSFGPIGRAEPEDRRRWI